MIVANVSCANQGEQPIFQTEALTLNEFLLVGAASSLVFFAVEIEKIISRRREKRSK